jgi:hypothetical protein
MEAESAELAGCSGAITAAFRLGFPDDWEEVLATDNLTTAVGAFITAATRTGAATPGVILSLSLSLSPPPWELSSPQPPAPAQPRRV